MLSGIITSPEGQDSTMGKPKTYLEHCDAWGMTQLGMGRFLGISPRQTRRYAANEADLPMSVRLLFKIMHKQGLTPEQVYKMANQPLPEEGFTDQRRK